MIIEYSEDNFTVIQEKEFAENIGHYRIIQFKSGQYALQVFEENWHTIIVCPHDNNDDGYLIVNNMLDFISRANDLYNKKNWYLKVELSDDGVETFTEIITKSDGETLIEQLTELYELEKEIQLAEIIFLPTYKKWRLISITVIIIVLILIIAFKVV